MNFQAAAIQDEESAESRPLNGQATIKDAFLSFKKDLEFELTHRYEQGAQARNKTSSLPAANNDQDCAKSRPGIELPKYIFVSSDNDAGTDAVARTTRSTNRGQRTITALLTKLFGQAYDIDPSRNFNMNPVINYLMTHKASPFVYCDMQKILQAGFSKEDCIACSIPYNPNRKVAKIILDKVVEETSPNTVYTAINARKFSDERIERLLKSNGWVAQEQYLPLNGDLVKIYKLAGRFGRMRESE